MVKKILLGLSVLFAVQAVWAVEVPDLYCADILVADTSSSALQKGIDAALGQVLIKISGNTAVMTLPAVQNNLPRIKNYVESYSYSTQAVDGHQSMFLHIVFDPKSMTQLLQNADQAIWGEDRPLTVVWLSLPQGSQNIVLSSETPNPLMQTLQKAAAARGIPMIFPTMDLEDEANVAQTISALPTNDQLQAIAQKYGVKSLLAGTIVNQADGQMESEWRLVLNGTPYEWQTTGSDLTQVVVNGLDRAADMMANQLAAIGSKAMENTVTLQIDGVQDLNDYSHVIEALKKLTPVVDVTVNDMSGSTLQLQVKTIGSVDQLVSALQDAANFVSMAAPAEAAPGNGDHLFYQWKEKP